MKIDISGVTEDIGDGQIKIELGDYTYFIGELEGTQYIQRQRNDYLEFELDRWEDPRWSPSDEIDFKFLRN